MFNDRAMGPPRTVCRQPPLPRGPNAPRSTDSSLSVTRPGASGKGRPGAAANAVSGRVSQLYVGANAHATGFTAFGRISARLPLLWHGLNHLGRVRVGQSARRTRSGG